MNCLTNNLLKKNIINNNNSKIVSSLLSNRGSIVNSFNSINNVKNNNSNSIYKNNINNNNGIRFYSTVSPTKKPNFQSLLFRTKQIIGPMNLTKEIFERIISMVDNGLLNSAETYVIRNLKNFQKEVDISSSLYGFPFYVAGLVSLKKGKYIAAEKFFRNSLSKYTEYDRTNIYEIDTLNSLGLNLLRQGKTQQAEEFLFNSYNLAIKTEVYNLLPHIFTNIGELYKELCYFDKASYYHGIANSHILATTSNKPKLDLARCYLNRSQVFRLSNKIEEAENFLTMGSENLIQYFREKYRDDRPKHMDWSKLLLEFGHLYYAKGDITKAKTKFISAKEHFNFMKNSSVPDAIMNNLNLAILEYNHQTLSSPEASFEFINGILNEIEPLIKDLKLQTSSLNMSRVNNVIKLLQKQSQYSKLTITQQDITNNSNNNNSNNRDNIIDQKTTKKVQKINLFEPQHFQLTYIKPKVPSIFQIYDL